MLVSQTMIKREEQVYSVVKRTMYIEHECTGRLSLLQTENIFIHFDDLFRNTSRPHVHK